jgi:hypothetical protein
MGAAGVPSGLPRRAVAPPWTGPAAATSLYTVTAVLLTWPLATALGTAPP